MSCVHVHNICHVFMFIIYVNELPEIVNCATNIFADDTSIYAIGETLSEITSSLQSAMTALSQDSRFKCIYSDINVQVQRYLSRRLPLRPFMIASMGATLEIIHRLI